MEPKEMHLDILGRSGALEDHDFIIVTDGSGTDVNRIGIGSAWILRSSAIQVNGEEVDMRGISGASFGSVQRAEFMALLDGLRALAGLLKLETLKEAGVFANKTIRTIEEFPPHSRPRVWWIGDRESLILQVARKSNGEPFYERRTEPDLWYALYWYEHLFQITAVYQPRNSTPDQTDVDAQAGKARDMFLPKEPVVFYELILDDCDGCRATLHVWSNGKLDKHGAPRSKVVRLLELCRPDQDPETPGWVLDVLKKYLAR